MTIMAEPCPCGSGQAFTACCGPLHAGGTAATAEALMRSRYAAFVLGDAGYLRATWLAEVCPAQLALGDTAWLGLRVLRCKGGGVDDAEGAVEFEAAFRDGGRVKALHETSRFVRRDGRWLYAGGEPRLRELGRNEPCPCGSGRKLKRCCAGPAMLGES